MNTNPDAAVIFDISSSVPATFAIPFNIFTQAGIEAVLILADGSREVLTLGDDYTLSTAPAASGTLTRVGTWTAGATDLWISRITDATHETDYADGSASSAEVLEMDFDRLVGMIQERTPWLARHLSGSLVVPADDTQATLIIPHGLDASKIREVRGVAYNASGSLILPCSADTPGTDGTLAIQMYFDDDAVTVEKMAGVTAGYPGTYTVHITIAFEA